MDLSDPNPATKVTTDSGQAVRLLTTLFDQSDLILFRHRRELADVDAGLVRLSTDRHDLLDQASRLEKQALAEQDRAERQLNPGYARQYREKAAQLEKDAAARRRDAQRVEKAHDELTKRRDRLEKQMRQA